MDLDGPGMRRMLDALEKVTDPRGNQVDWTADIRDVDTQARAWQDYDPDGGYDPTGGGGGSRGLFEASVLEAVRPDPGRYALTNTFAAAGLSRTTNSGSPNINPDRTNGAALTRVLRHQFEQLTRDLNNGRRRTTYGQDPRTPLALKQDRDHARIMNEAILRASSGQPGRATQMMRQVAEAMREQKRGSDATRVLNITDTLAEMYSPVLTEADRLHGINSGDRIVLAGDQDHDAPRVYTAAGVPTTVLRRDDGTTLTRFSATGPDNSSDTVEVDTADTNYAARINPTHGGSAQEYLSQEAAGSWAIVAAGQQLPQTTQDTRELSRRAVEAFYAAQDPQPSGAAA